MASNTIPKIDSGGGGSIIASDSSQADSIPRRDSNQDVYAAGFRAATSIRTAGNLYVDQQAKSANFTIDESSNNGTIYNVTTAGSPITVTLEAASGVTDKVITVKKVDTGAGTVVIDGNASETTEGKTTFTLYTFGDVVTLSCDGSNWRIVGASLSPVVLQKTANFTADDQPFTEFVYICDSTSGSITATLPAVSGLKGRALTFKKIVAGNNLVLDGAASEQIDDATTKTSATNYAHYRIICDGVEWWNVAVAGTWT